RQPQPRDRRILGASLEVPGDLRRALRPPCPVTRAVGRAPAWPLENLRHQPPRQRAPQGLLRQRAAVSSVRQSVDREAARGTAVGVQGPGLPSPRPTRLSWCRGADLCGECHPTTSRGDITVLSAYLRLSCRAPSASLESFSKATESQSHSN